MKKVKMTLERPLPWYATLLGVSPEGEKFDRLVSQFNLSSDDDDDAGVRWYENEQLGVSAYILEGKLNSIQFFSSENPHFKGCLKQLPLGLSFEMAHIEVRQHLGDPDNVTGERVFGTMKHAGIDRYYTLHCTVAVTYSATSGQIAVLGFERPRRRS